MKKEKTHDIIAEISIAPVNPVIINNAVRLCLKNSGNGGRKFYNHKIYIFDRRPETYKFLRKDDWELFLKAVQFTARVVIKEKKLNIHGKDVKITYINLFEAEEKKSKLTLSDISRHHNHYLKDKEILWNWKDENGGHWNLVLFVC